MKTTAWERLREERNRLGYKSHHVAAQLKMSYPGYMKYEKGESGLSQKRIEALAALGFDVLYIQTGQRVGATAAETNNLEGIRIEIRECKEGLSRTERALQDMRDIFTGRLEEVLERVKAERGSVRRDSGSHVDRHRSR